MKKLVYLVDIISKGQEFAKGYAISKKVMEPLEQFFYMFIVKNFIPQGEGRENVNFRNLQLIECFTHGSPINLPSLMLQHIAHVMKEPKEVKIPYACLIRSICFEYWFVLCFLGNVENNLNEVIILC